MKEKLAIHGGKKSRVQPFPSQPGPNIEDTPYAANVEAVISTKVLSGYRGNATPAFYGGPYVQEFEDRLEKKFNGKALACNSATSGLWIACAAIGLRPGDEVIVTPWSMSCSATVPLLFGAIPVFADIEPDTFCLDPEDVKRKITDRTKAIIAVDLFGQPYSYEINEIAKEHNIYVIEDAAQAIGSYGVSRILEGERVGAQQYAGLIGDIGVFSFTQGKHLTAGEGGAIVTGDPILYERAALLRNHAEAVTHDGTVLADIPENPVGLNLRMTEIQAAIMLVELDRLDSYIADRRKWADRFRDIFIDTGILSVAPTRDGATHSYYVLPFLVDPEYAHLSKDIAEALRAELMPDEIRLDRGVPISSGYIDPLYRFPVFQKRNHWAYSLAGNEGNSATYIKGTCPVAERYTDEGGLIITLLHGLALSDHDFSDIEKAFRKVLGYFEEVVNAGV